MYFEETNEANNEPSKNDIFMQDFKYYKKLKPNDYSQPIETILYLDKLDQSTLAKFNLKVLQLNSFLYPI